MNEQLAYLDQLATERLKKIDELERELKETKIISSEKIENMKSDYKKEIKEVLDAARIARDKGSDQRTTIARMAQRIAIQEQELKELQKAYDAAASWLEYHMGRIREQGEEIQWLKSENAIESLKVYK